MLSDLLKDKKIVLASQSPRRRELLKGLDVDFTVINPAAGEDYPDGLKKEEIAVYLAEKKAGSVHSVDNNNIIIASDTIVCLGDDILNKPAGRTEAIEMINRLSGSRHTVITGVCIRNGNRNSTFFSETEVFFSELETEEIEYYVDTYKPYDKAGSYGIQEWIGFIGIEKIRGSYFNVMGLPVQRLYRELKKIIVN